MRRRKRKRKRRGRRNRRRRYRRRKKRKKGDEFEETENPLVIDWQKATESLMTDFGINLTILMPYRWLRRQNSFGLTFDRRL